MIVLPKFLLKKYAFAVSSNLNIRTILLSVEISGGKKEAFASGHYTGLQNKPEVLSVTLAAACVTQVCHYVKRQDPNNVLKNNIYMTVVPFLMLFYLNHHRITRVINYKLHLST